MELKIGDRIYFLKDMKITSFEVDKIIISEEITKNSHEVYSYYKCLDYNFLEKDFGKTWFTSAEDLINYIKDSVK